MGNTFSHLRDPHGIDCMFINGLETILFHHAVERYAFFPPCHVHDEIARYAEEKSADVLNALPFREILPRATKRLLYDILRRLTVAHPQKRVTKECVRMLLIGREKFPLEILLPF